MIRPKNCVHKEKKPDSLTDVSLFNLKLWTKVAENKDYSNNVNEEWKGVFEILPLRW